MARIDEIAPDIYRISLFNAEAGMQFNHFLIRDEEPLLYHAGYKAMFPILKEAISKLIDPAQLKWVGFSHFESDECGALNEWLSIAQQAQAVTGIVGAMVNVNDFAIRPARILQDKEILCTGKKSLRYLRTPHVPHGWDAGLFFEETDKTLFTSDLFHQNGDVEAITQTSLSDRCSELLKGMQQSPFSEYIPYTRHVDSILCELADYEPKTLAVMHGSSYSGNGKKAIHELAGVWKEVLS
ncbi:MBL fold metallo-hydrolase [Brevibacillus choshinensis]|uniref:MBL fold metallo-hydrolase n=1 Tax=Brevibacillus choshinensis TaxID=54911 RepID=A0ABR5N436_BRECH|nr:MBL fold metallo-hydrolase [Brevibacillus choshinensis]KQL45277.1 MBL fold metallo-hydrolase [Brevibacillus choshinensis]